MVSPTLVDEINARHGTSYRAAGRYSEGEQGALRVVDETGRAFVVKGSTPTPGAEIAAATEALRRVGYPAPRYVIAEDAYSVQEELPGAPLPIWEPLEDTTLARLLELNELQEGRAVSARRDWPRLLLETVLVGETTYMVLDTLVRHSEEARALLERCQATVERFAADVTATEDIVHWDFHSLNVLADGDRVTGVIDWDATTAADRFFDLATLSYFFPRDARLERYAAPRVDRGVFAAYLAHMCVREADWSLRLYGGETGDRALRHAIDVAASFPT